VLPPQNLTVTGSVEITGTVDTNLTEIVGVAPPVPGRIATDIGATNPNPLALESGGNLASVETNTGDLASIIYTPGSPPAQALATGVIDPAQVSVTAGKAVPVKTET
jgi:hypothetical protein